MERDNDKNPVVALREIADETIDPNELEESLVHGMQKHVEVDEPEEDDISLLLAGRKLEEDKLDITEENLAKAAAEMLAELNIDDPTAGGE